MGATGGDFFKYPRTPHLFHSPDTDADDKRLSWQQSLDFIKHPGLVIEEKLDGTNCGTHFQDGRMVLQCRGHEITSGMHPQYDMLKTWANMKRDMLEIILGEQYIMFGEWLVAHHTVKYNRLPHFFMEFDVYDKDRGIFLDTNSRANLFQGNIVPVTVTYRGPVSGPDELDAMIGQSLFSDETAEGLYLKIEENGECVQRAKYVRQSFIKKVSKSEHWQYKKMEMNELAPGVDIWS